MVLTSRRDRGAIFGPTNRSVAISESRNRKREDVSGRGDYVQDTTGAKKRENVFIAPPSNKGKRKSLRDYLRRQDSPLDRLAMRDGVGEGGMAREPDSRSLRAVDRGKKKNEQSLGFRYSGSLTSRWVCTQADGGKGRKTEVLSGR